MTTDEIVRTAVIATADVCFAPAPEPGEKKHITPAIFGHLTALAEDVRLEVGITVPNWLPSPGSTDVTIGKGEPYRALIEVKVWQLGWCLWDMVKVASLVQAGKAEAGYLVVVATRSKFAKRPGFGEILDEHAAIATADLFTTYKADWLDLLGGGSGRPVRLPARLQTHRLTTQPLEHAPVWEIRAIKVSIPPDAGDVKSTTSSSRTGELARTPRSDSRLDTATRTSSASFSVRPDARSAD
jgi:hypothetical protein